MLEVSSQREWQDGHTGPGRRRPWIGRGSRAWRRELELAASLPAQGTTAETGILLD